MFYLLADAVVLLHFGFVLFAVFGGFLALKWRRVVWLHVPCVIIAAMAELMSWICPLTWLENWLRRQGGAGAFQGDFIKHYILPILYPANLTYEFQIFLGVSVIVFNLVVYFFVVRSWKRHGKEWN